MVNCSGQGLLCGSLLVRVLKILFIHVNFSVARKIFIKGIVENIIYENKNIEKIVYGRVRKIDRLSNHYCELTLLGLCTFLLHFGGLHVTVPFQETWLNIAEKSRLDFFHKKLNFTSIPEIPWGQSVQVQFDGSSIWAILDHEILQAPMSLMTLSSAYFFWQYFYSLNLVTEIREWEPERNKNKQIFDLGTIYSVFIY